MSAARPKFDASYADTVTRVTGLPSDRPFWIEDPYGEIVQVRYSWFASLHAPWWMFVPVDDEEAQPIAHVDIADWNEDRDALIKWLGGEVQEVGRAA